MRSKFHFLRVIPLDLERPYGRHTQISVLVPEETDRKSPFRAGLLVFCVWDAFY